LIKAKCITYARQPDIFHQLVKTRRLILLDPNVTNRAPACLAYSCVVYARSGYAIAQPAWICACASLQKMHRTHQRISAITWQIFAPF